MTNTENFVQQYDMVHEWLAGILGAFSDDDMKLSLSPSKNHALWILGHLVASEDDLAAYLGKGGMMFPQYAEIFSQGKKLIPPEECPTPQELKDALEKVTEKNRAILKSLKDEELDTPHALVKEGSEDYFGTKRRVIMAWQLHQVYHTGQLGAILSLAGKKVYG